MSLDGFARRFAIDRLIAAAGAAVRPDGRLLGRRPAPSVVRRRHGGRERQRDDEDTVTLHGAPTAGEEPAEDLVERLRRASVRKSP